jgi:hypothetical protein
MAESTQDSCHALRLYKYWCLNYTLLFIRPTLTFILWVLLTVVAEEKLTILYKIYRLSPPRPIWGSYFLQNQAQRCSTSPPLFIYSDSLLYHGALRIQLRNTQYGGENPGAICHGHDCAYYCSSSIHGYTSFRVRPALASIVFLLIHLFVAGLLLHGAPPEHGVDRCSIGMLVCILLYGASKGLIYLCMIERVRFTEIWTYPEAEGSPLGTCCLERWDAKMAFTYLPILLCTSITGGFHSLSNSVLLAGLTFWWCFAAWRDCGCYDLTKDCLCT